MGGVVWQITNGMLLFKSDYNNMTAFEEVNWVCIIRCFKDTVMEDRVESCIGFLIRNFIYLYLGFNVYDVKTSHSVSFGYSAR